MAEGDASSSWYSRLGGWLKGCDCPLSVLFERFSLFRVLLPVVCVRVPSVSISRACFCCFFRLEGWVLPPPAVFVGWILLNRCAGVGL